ncbi:hypothetical protein AK830_g6312 [Neonectria ditissima]|uniref:Uncharacterized protein n=1 Tax=Neonectria ditissima TaxID=78410 RepID=A0A0P7B2C7_9HYPO|nr:hypothetical protein AK830_g6312 [Neonectria ditissima]
MCDRASIWSECNTCSIITFVEYRHDPCQPAIRTGRWCRAFGSFAEVFPIDAESCLDCQIAALEEKEALDDALDDKLAEQERQNAVDLVRYHVDWCRDAHQRGWACHVETSYYEIHPLKGADCVDCYIVSAEAEEALARAFRDGQGGGQRQA